MGKFIREKLSLKRIPSELITDTKLGAVTTITPERLILTVEYVGDSETIKITSEEIMSKLKELLGEILTI